MPWNRSTPAGVDRHRALLAEAGEGVSGAALRGMGLGDVEPAAEEGFRWDGPVEGFGTNLFAVFDVDGNDALIGGAEFEAMGADLEAQGGADPGGVDEGTEAVAEGSGGGEKRLGEGAVLQHFDVWREEPGGFALDGAGFHVASTPFRITIVLCLQGFQIVF